VGLLRRAGPGDVPAIPRRGGLLVRLLATTPRVSASWWSSTTRRTARMRRGLATEKPPEPGSQRTLGPRAERAPHLTGEGH
jgi:hypothetical protein